MLPAPRLLLRVLPRMALRIISAPELARALNLELVDVVDPPDRDLETFDDAD